MIQDILDHVTESVVVLDTNLCFLMFNQAFEQRFLSAFGRKPVRGLSLLEALNDMPEEQALVGSLWRRALAGEAFTVVREFGKPDLTRQISETSYNCLRDKEGTIIGAVHVSRDVTARVRAEENLKLTAARLAEAQSLARIGSWEYDVASDQITWSEEMFRLLAFDPEQGVPSMEEIRSRYHSDDQPLHDAAIQKALEEGKPGEFDLRVVYPDGRQSWIHAIVRVEKDAEGQVVRLLGVVMDISERKQGEQAQERLTAILEKTSDFVATATPDGRMLYCNQALREFLGVTESQVPALRVRDLHSPESWEIAQRELIPATEREGHWSGEAVYVSGQGSEIPVSLKVFIHKDAQGKALYRSAIVRDISAQKETEETLRKAQVRLEEAQHLARIGSWEHDIATGETVWSKELFRLMERDPLLWKPHYRDIPSLFIPEDADRLSAAVQRSVQENIEYELVLRRVAKSGEMRYYQALGNPVTDESGKVVRLIGTCKDITERKHQELKLRESEARFQAEYRGNPIPTYTWQWRVSEFILIDFNEAAREFTHGKIEAYLGQSDCEIYADYPEIIEVMTRCFREQTNIQKEMAYTLRSTGEKKDLIIDYVFVPPDLIMVHTQDITRRKQLEEQYRQAQKMEGIGRLAGGIAHDFNNLLAIIMGYAELVSESLPDTDDLHGNLQNIQNAAARAANLTQQLLAFARKQAVTPVVLQPNEVLARMVTMLRPLLGETIELISRFDPEVGQIYMDANQLEQVIVNLAINARDAMPQGGKLIIKTEKTVFKDALTHELVLMPAGEYAVLTISDSGEGMTEEVKERLFEPFFTTKEKGKGTGLGLATVYGIVKQNRGFIWVSSELGGGTTFKVYLPCAESTAAISASERKDASDYRGTETILVAEDEEMLRQFTATTLRNRGFQVLEASDGIEALQRVEQHSGPIHLLLTDAIMPRMGGLELAQTLRSTHPETVVLLVSGYSEEMFTGEALASRGVTLLQKPFTTGGLLQKVREMLTEGAKPQSD